MYLIIDPRLQLMSVSQQSVSLDGVLQLSLAVFAFVHQVFIPVDQRILISSTFSVLTLEDMYSNQ